MSSETNNQKNKILFVGANDLLVPAINFTSNEYQVIICESGTFKIPLSKNVQVVKLKKLFFGIEKLLKTDEPLPFYFFNLNRILRQEKPDIIIIMDWVRLWYWQTFVYKLKNPLTKIIVYSETQKVPKKFFKKIVFKIFLKLYKLTEKYVSSYWVYTKLGKDFAEKNNFNALVQLIAVPVDTNHFVQKEYTPKAKDNYLKVLMNSRYQSYKRHIDLIEAVHELRLLEKYCHVTFIGRDTNAVSIVKNMVKTYQLESLITFLDSVSFQELPSMYHEHDVLVLPSDNEPIGMVVPEAMACGLPTITSDTVGANVYVEEGVTGLIFPTGNPQALAEKLTFFFDEYQVRKMGEAARMHIEKFSINNMNQAFLDALHHKIRD